MNDFKRVVTDSGIPLFYSYSPSVKFVSFRCLMFTGSADDASVGVPGAYHWFEHVPFRGSRLYPEGDKQTTAFLKRHAGMLNAHTGSHLTAFIGNSPVSVWKKGLEICVDLISNPLMRTIDIEAESTVISKEISRSLSSLSGYMSHQTGPILWGDHPVAHHPLGTRANVTRANAQLLHEARTKGYSRSRMAIIIAGNVTLDEARKEVERLAEITPDNPIEPRSGPATFGKLPWSPGKRTLCTAPFDSSSVVVMFPTDTQENDPRIFTLHRLAKWMIDHGGLSSPLSRIVRGERQLVYTTNVAQRSYRDGGAFGLEAMTEQSDTEMLEQAFWDVLRSDEIRSKDRFEYLHDYVKYSRDMDTIDPDNDVSGAENQLGAKGYVISDDEYDAIALSVTLDEIVAFLDSLKPELAHTIVFKGK